MEIYIPSTGRAAHQTTLAGLPKELRKRTALVVPLKEVVSYLQIADQHGCKVIGCPAKGIAATRQWIIDHARDQYVFMIDDDMRFYKRKRSGEIALVKCEPGDIGAMFDALLKWLKTGVAHVGVCARFESSYYLIDYRVVARVNNFHGYDRKVIQKEKIRFDALPLMEDFHMTLSLLERGYPNVVLYDYCWNQDASNRAGGCSSYRNASMQAASAKTLKKFHPDVVKIVTKESKASSTSWEGMKQRVDVNIQWRKSYTGPVHPHWKLELESRRGAK